MNELQPFAPNMFSVLPKSFPDSDVITDSDDIMDSDINFNTNVKTETDFKVDANIEVDSNVIIGNDAEADTSVHADVSIDTGIKNDIDVKVQTSFKDVDGVNIDTYDKEEINSEVDDNIRMEIDFKDVEVDAKVFDIGGKTDTYVKDDTNVEVDDKVFDTGGKTDTDVKGDTNADIIKDTDITDDNNVDVDVTIETGVNVESNVKVGADNEQFLNYGSEANEYAPSENESVMTDVESHLTSDYEYSDDEQSDTSDENSSTESMNDIVLPSSVWHTVDGTHRKNFKFNDVSHTPGIIDFKSQPIKPIDVFNLMVTDDVYYLIAHQTNINAQQVLLNTSLSRSSRFKNWKDTDVEEIKKFLAIIMYMGLVKYPSICLYWSKNILYKNNFVSRIMSRNRFQLLLRFIHFYDNHKAGTDQLAKIRNFLKILENNFVAAKIPGEFIAIDESILPWHGSCLAFQQYNPRKTHKYGVKIYKLCDPSGYTYTSCVCTGNISCGQRGIPTAEASHSKKIVMNLSEKYLMKGRTVATDNFYTSISLAKELLKKKTHLLGTLRQNQKGNPKEVTEAKLKKGQIVGREDEDGVVVAKWRSTQEVTMLSTKHDLSYVFTGKKNRNNEEIRKPNLIVAYNYAKQGIDVSDQMSSYFSPLRKTIRWYHKVAFEFLLNTAVINAFIIYKELQKKDQHIANFRQSIIESLSGLHVIDAPKFSSPNKHKLEEYGERDKRNRKVRKRCTKCYSQMKKSVGRHKALKNSKQVTTYCDKCEGNPAICLECFNKYH